MYIANKFVKDKTNNTQTINIHVSKYFTSNEML